MDNYNFFNISIISYYEILNGLLYKDAKKQLENFKYFVEQNKILPLTPKSTEISAKKYSDLRKKGITVSHTDVLIAGIAIAFDKILVSNNTKHFEVIDNLQLINWSI